MRPDVLLRGERLSYDLWSNSVRAMKDADLLLILGTSMEVAPVNTLPQYIKKQGCRCVIINMDKFDVEKVFGKKEEYSNQNIQDSVLLKSWKKNYGLVIPFFNTTIDAVMRRLENLLNLKSDA